VCRHQDSLGNTGLMHCSY